MLRLHNIGKWTQAAAGAFLHFPGVDGRRIDLDLNTEAPTRVDVIYTEGEDEVTRFLAAVNGRETVQFTVEQGDVYLSFSSDGEVWFYTPDGENTAIERIDAVSFTRMMERQPERNHDLELIMYKARQNEQRREAALAAALGEVKALRDALAPKPLTEDETAAKALADAQALVDAAKAADAKAKAAAEGADA